MQSRRTLLATGAVALGLTGLRIAPARAAEPMPVVATFSILGDMVARIGGAHVAVTTLVGPNGDTHVYQPTPADARAVSDAQLLIVNGLAFEGWLDRLVQASGFSGHRVVATDGIDAIAYGEGGAHDGEAHHDDHDGEDAHKDHDDHHDEHAHDDEHDHHHHGAFDPHGWQSLSNAVIYAGNIAAALAEADPANAGAYEANRAAYVAELEALDAEIRGILGALPEDRRTIVTSHDAFQYFGRDYGLTFVSPQGLSTESEASAKDIARLIERIREENIAAVFVENITDRRLLDQIARETGATIGGTLYPGALSDPDGLAPTYLQMMRHNAITLAAALSS